MWAARIKWKSTRFTNSSWPPYSSHLSTGF